MAENISGTIRGMGTERRCERCTICGRVAEYPCSKRQTVKVAFKVASLDTLRDAVKELGWTMQVTGTRAVVRLPSYQSIALDLADGTVECEEGQKENLAKLKAMYAWKTVQNIAKQGRFTLNATMTNGKIVGTLAKWGV